MALKRNEKRKSGLRLPALLLLAGLFSASLAGCGGKERKEEAMGRYVEEELAVIADAEQATGLFLTEKGEPVFYAVHDDGKTVERCGFSKDEGTLVRTPAAWAEGMGDIVDISEAADGTVCFAATDSDGGTEIFRVKDGRAEAVFPPEAEKPKELEEGKLCGVRSLPGGDFLLLFGMDGVSLFHGRNASEGETWPVVGYNWNTAVHDGRLLSPGMGKDELLIFDLETGEQKEAAGFEKLSAAACLGLDASGIYVADTSGIYRLPSDGSEWEQLADGALTSLSLPSLMPAGVTGDGGDGCYALLCGEGGLHLMHYVFDPMMPAVPDKTLTIFGLKDSSTIRQAIGVFQRQHPDVRVDFQTASQEVSPDGTQDVIKRLNTELLNHKGPDLLLDGLPVQSYMEKGVLADLSDLAERLEESGLMKNMTEAWRLDGRCYGLPGRFTVSVMAGEEEALESVGSLGDLAACVEERQAEETAFLVPSPRLAEEGGMLMDYYDICSGEFVNGAGVDEEALAQYFSDMLRIQRAQEAALGEAGEDRGKGRMTMFELVGLAAEPSERGRKMFYIQQILGENATNMLPEDWNDTGEKQALMPALSGSGYRPGQAVGMTASCGQQELALSFLETLLSPAVQDLNLYDGFPVNSGSLERLAEKAMEEEEERADFLSMCSGLDTPIFTDQVIKEAVQRQTAELVNGTVSPEEAAGRVAEEVGLYLSE